MEILWSRRHYVPSFHDKDKVVVWESSTGDVKYPPRNDVPMPERYKQQGYQRRELSSLQEIHRFEKQHNVLSEIAWFDRNGRGHDSEVRRPKMR